MAHYAFLDSNNIVTEVIVGVEETELIEGLDPETWYGDFRGQTCKRTSYNTFAGQHSSGGTPFRKNYAGIGYVYDPVRDAFMTQQPYSTWILNEDTCVWESPVPIPDISNLPEPYIFYNRYEWNDTTVSWDLVQPFPSWVLNMDGYYEAPVAYPTEAGDYYWDEDALNWISVVA